MTNGNNQPFWQTRPRTTKAQDKFLSEFRRNGNATSPNDLLPEAEEGRTSDSPWTIPGFLRSELSALFRSEARGPFARLLGIEGKRTAFTEEQIQRLPGPAQSLARAANELTSPFNVALTVATAGLGPAAVTSVKAAQAALRTAVTQGNRGLATRLADRVMRVAGPAVSAVAAPITRGGFGQRLAAEQVLGLGAGVAAQETARRIPETAPAFVRYGAPLAAGLAGGGLALGGIAGARAVAPTLRPAVRGARLRAGQQVSRIPGAGELGLQVGGIPGMAGGAPRKPRPVPTEALAAPPPRIADAPTGAPTGAGDVGEMPTGIPKQAQAKTVSIPKTAKPVPDGFSELPNLKGFSLYADEVISHSGRDMVVVRLPDGTFQPFYKRTGRGGPAKEAVPGTWVPFDGVANDANPAGIMGWFNKAAYAAGDDVNAPLFRLGSQQNRRISAALKSMEESLPSAREVADNFEVNQWLGVPEGFMNQGPGIGKGPTRTPVTAPTAARIAKEDLLTERQFKAREQAVIDTAEEARQADRSAARAAEQVPTPPDMPGAAVPGEGVVGEALPIGPGEPRVGAGAGGGRRGGEPPTTVEGDPLPIPPEIDVMPEGITRDLALAEEKIRQAEPGAISRALDALPGLRHLYRFFVPARNLTKAQHTAWVAKSMSESRYLTTAFGLRNAVFRELDSAFGSGFKTGEKAQLSYIGPSDRAGSPLVGRAIDVLPNPDHYVLSQPQIDAIASVRAYGDGLLDMASEQYGVKIGRFPIKENSAFVPNVDVSDNALELMGDAWTAARVGRAKTRVWEDAISRQAYTPDFQPETNLVRLFEASDVAKGNMVAKEVFKEAVGGKTRVEIIDALHPNLRKYKESIATKIRNLRARIETAERESALATRQEKQVRTQVSQSQKRAQPMLERIDELGDEFGPELSYLSGQTRELLLSAAALERRGVVLTLRREAAAARGIDLAVELDKLTPLLDVLSKRYKAASTGKNVLVQKGIFRYFPKTEADSLEQLLEVSTNPVLSAAWEIRNLAFNLDLSPITGVHLPLAFLADPVGTVGQLVRGTRTAAQKRQFLKDLTPAGLAEKIEGDPTWSEFAAVSGRPVGQTATEFAGGFLRRIPGYSRANDMMFTAVTYRAKAMYDVLVQDYVKAGIPRNEAIIAASENVHRVIPLMDHAVLGQSQARAKLLQSITISPSFIFRPPELMAEAATALVKVGLKQTLTTKQKMALRTAMIMAATIETISVTSAVMDAWRNDKDVWKAGISATDDMAIRLMDGRKIPLGGPYRSLINALKPEWVNRDMDYKMPFTRVPRWAAGKLTPAFRRQIDLLRNKDFRGRRITTGDFPSNIMQIVAYEFEGAVPLTIGAWVEGLRTGATLAKTAEEAITQFGGTSLYDRPGPWAMRTEWRDELRQYGGIPTDPNKIGTKEYPISRTRYRQRNPMTDAKLFILGDVTSLMSIRGTPSGSMAIPFVLSLIREHDIDPDDIRGIRDRKDDRAAAEEAGRRLTPNPVDRLIGLLEEARPVETAPAPREPTPALPTPTPALPTPTPAMPTQPEALSTPTIEEFSRRLREYLAARETKKTPEPVGAP